MRLCHAGQPVGANLRPLAVNLGQTGRLQEGRSAYLGGEQSCNAGVNNLGVAK